MLHATGGLPFHQFQKKKDGKNLRFGCGLVSGCTFFMAFIFAIIALVAALIPCCTGSECDLDANDGGQTLNLPQNAPGVDSMDRVVNRLPLFWATTGTSFPSGGIGTYLEGRESFLKRSNLLYNAFQHIAHQEASGVMPLSEGQFRDMCEHECKKYNSVNQGEIAEKEYWSGLHEELVNDRCYFWVLREDSGHGGSSKTDHIEDKQCFLFSGKELGIEVDTNKYGKTEFKRLYTEDAAGDATDSLDTSKSETTKTIGGTDYNFPDISGETLVLGFVGGNRYTSGDNFVVKTNKASTDVEILFEVSESVNPDTVALRLNNDHSFISTMKYIMTGLNGNYRMGNNRYSRGFSNLAITDDAHQSARKNRVPYVVNHEDLEFGSFKVSSASSVPTTFAMTDYEPVACPVGLTSVRRLTALKKMFTEKKIQKNNLRKLGSSKVLKLRFEMFVLSDDATMASVNQQILSNMFSCQKDCFISESTGMIATAQSVSDVDKIVEFDVDGGSEKVEVMGVVKMQKEIAYALSQVDLLNLSMKKLKIVNDGSETAVLESDKKIGSKSYLKYMSQSKIADSVVKSVHAADTAEECRGVCANDKNCAAWEFDYQIQNYNGATGVYGNSNTCVTTNTLCPVDDSLSARKFTFEHNIKVCETTVNSEIKYGLYKATASPSSACKTVHRSALKDEKSFNKNIMYAPYMASGFMRGDAFSYEGAEATDEEGSWWWNPNPEKKKDSDGRKPKCSAMRIVWITFLSAFCVFLVISAVSFGIVMYSLFKARKEQNVRGMGNNPFDPYGASPEQLEMQQRWLRHKAMTRGGERSVYGSDRKSRRSESESGRSRSSKHSKRSSKSKKSKRSKSSRGEGAGASYVIGQSNPTSMVIGQSQPQVITLNTSQPQGIYGQPQTTQYVVRNSSQPRVQSYSVQGSSVPQQSQPVRLVVRNQSPSVYGQQPRYVSRARSVA